GYPPSAADSRYGGASSVPAAGFGANDPYSYGKAPPSADYQQEAVSTAGPGGGAGYVSANPYDDRSNANIINRGYSTQPYG
ncbi:hypothetical protein ALC56_01165, partial [Trachymyrmex septentrionalis]